MTAKEWTKIEDEVGYPCYIKYSNGKNERQRDHPVFSDLMEKINNYKDLKYAAYRMGYKATLLRDSLKVPPTRLILGVFSRHCLSISESSLTLEPCEIEAILTDIYFAANKEELFSGEIDTTAEIVLNLLLNIYDLPRTSYVKVQAAKCALLTLSNDSSREKWRQLFNLYADHNGCLSPRRMGLMLTQIAQIAEYLDEKSFFGSHLVQAEVDKCFTKTPGMLGLSEHDFFDWLFGDSPPNLISWLDVCDRISNSIGSDNLNISWKCSLCKEKGPNGLHFKCTKCCNVLLCEKCYLYNDEQGTSNRRLTGHKKSHVVKEVFDVEATHPECMGGFVQKFKRMFYCTSNHGTIEADSNIRYPLKDPRKILENVSKQDADQQSSDNGLKNEPKMFTSTIGKATGNSALNPGVLLQDIIAQLENQNKALQDLSTLLAYELDSNNGVDKKIKYRVDRHWGQIATQINRLKFLKETLNNCSGTSPETRAEPHSNKTTNVHAFDLFSPIPMLQEETPPDDMPTRGRMPAQPRVLSLDSGHFSDHNEYSKGADERLPAINSAGQAAKQTILHVPSDSISTVSMQDISTWFSNDIELQKLQSGHSGRVVKFPTRNIEKRVSDMNFPFDAGKKSANASEIKFDADLASVASSNNKMKELNADLDSVLDRLQQILANNFALDETTFDNTQLKETANEMEGLLGTLIRGVEQRRTLNGRK